MHRHWLWILTITALFALCTQYTGIEYSGPLRGSATTAMTTFRAATPVPTPGGSWTLNPLAAEFFPSNSQGEGASLAVVASEVLSSCSTGEDDWRTKQHGGTPTTGSRPTMQRRVGKRALLRACRRAYCNSYTWYKGQCLAWNDFPAEVQNVISAHMTATPDRLQSNQQWTQTPRHRLVTLTYNCGGLTTTKYHDTLTWLRSIAAECVALTETHWKFTSEWQTEDYWCLHSGSSSTSDGILILLSRKLCTEQCLQWREILPGRLVHVKMAYKHRSVDILGCYQWVQDNKPGTSQNRTVFFAQLDHALQNLAQRNLLVLLGDFNTSLTTADDFVGSGHYRWNGQSVTGPTHADSGALHDIIRHHHLCALNTFGPNGPTYQLHHVSSRIDYIITRHNTTDGFAKATMHMTDAPIRTNCRAGHIPIMTSLPTGWLPQHRQHRHPQATFRQRQRCREDWHCTADRWQHFVEEAGRRVHAQMSTTDGFSVAGLHHAVLPLFIRTYGAPPQSVPRDTGDTLNKWYHLRMIKKLTTPNLTSLFSAWKHWTTFTKLDRQHARHLHQIKKQKLDRLHALAARAEHHHDSYGLFKIIQETTQRKPKHRLQLRTATGDLATPVEAQAQVRAYVQTAWAGTPSWPLPAADPPGVPFTRHMLLLALQQIPTAKAVAPGFVPGPIWRELAPQIVDPIMDQLQIWWNISPPFVPPEWRNAWLSLIPKPRKRACHPRDLRPLALQEPVGKSIIGLLGSLARHQILHTLNQWPQMAFLPLRSTQDCIIRVTQHCRLARELVQAHQPSVKHRARQARPPQICGGIQLCADITRAFDAVSRPKLFEALSRVGVSTDLIILLQQWHMDCEYILTGFQSPEGVPIGRGVRQGCKIAPLLWCVLMADYLMTASDRLGSDFIKQFCTLYADDLHLCSTFHSKHEFEVTLQCFGKMIALLKDLDLELSPEKSKALCTMVGPLKRDLQAQHFLTIGGRVHLQIPMPDHTMVHVPLVTSTIYLGICISYHHFELETMQLRLRAARNGFGKLKKWLVGRKHLTTGGRLRLWRQCVWPIATYGLAGTGITRISLREFTQTMTMQIRQVIFDHSFYTGNSNRQAFDRLGLPDPATSLLTLVRDQHHQAITRQLATMPHDIIRMTPWTHIAQTEQILLDGQDLWTPSHPSNLALHWLRCPFCVFTTTSSVELKRHCTTAHRYRRYTSHNIRFDQTACDGLPQCKHCLREFATWRQFRRHIAGARCQAPTLESMTGLVRGDPEADRLTPLPSALPDAWPRNIANVPLSRAFVDYVLADDWDSLMKHDGLLDHMTNHCVLCNRWLGRPQDMRLHLVGDHGVPWTPLCIRGAQLTSLHGDHTPCQLCQKRVRTVHLCKVTHQAALVQLYAGPASDRPELSMDWMSLDAHDAKLDNSRLT